MSFQSKVGVTYTSIANFLEDGTNGLHAALVAMGWSLYYTYVATTGLTDKVFLSAGEDGTEVQYVRIKQVDATHVTMFIASYYVASGAAPGANDGNEVGISTYTGWMLSSASIVGWIYGDKDFVVFTTKQDSFYSTWGFGHPKRTVPTQWSARTTLNGAQNLLGSGSGNTVLTVNTFDTTKLTAGQKLFIVNNGPTNKGTIGRCTIVSVDSATQITALNDNATQTNFDTGALVGYDPEPTCILGHTQVYGVNDRGCPTSYASFIYDMAVTRLTGTAQNTPTHMFSTQSFGYMTTTEYSSAQYGYAFDNPGAGGEFAVMPILLAGAHNSIYAGTITAGSNQVRGYLERICSITYGAVLSAEDTLSDGATTWIAFKDEYGSGTWANYWKYFAVRSVA